MIENQVINKIIDYILSHIENEFSVDQIAEYCGYSKYYISRLFKTETGESIYSFIKRLKVEQSAFRLKIEKTKTVTEIGESYGYSPSNYATLFKEHFNETPNTFRKEILNRSIARHFYKGIENKLETYEECCKNITIEYFNDYFVLYERRKGDYKNLRYDWCEFMERYKAFITPDSIFIERTLDDPSITKQNNCLYDICMTVDKNDPRLKIQKTAAAGVTSNAQTPAAPNTMTIQGGKFAVYHYKGYPQMIYSAYQSFFSSWLSDSGNKLDSRGGFDIYRKIDSETLYMELDICIPIK